MSIAESVYGVVVDVDGVLDRTATDSARARIRSDRLGHEPARGVLNPDAPSAVVVYAGSWRCSSCEAALVGVDQNWRSTAKVRESPLHRRLPELGAWAREAATEHPIVAREYYCPSCASVLSVDVTFANKELVAAARPGIIDPYPATAMT